MIPFQAEGARLAGVHATSGRALRRTGAEVKLPRRMLLHDRKQTVNPAKSLSGLDVPGGEGKLWRDPGIKAG